MYKLVVIDDESIIREGLKHTVDWHSLGFQVAGEAENGVKGLEIIRELNPHVVLTDIRMPVMDGLALLKSVKQEMPETKIILLSGHEEFEYAKEGMLLGAEGYILKLDIEKDLPPVFEKIVCKLENEEKTKGFVDSLKSEYNELMYDTFFRKAISGEVTGGDVSSFLEKNRDIPLQEGAFCAVCIQFENTGESGCEESITEKKESFHEFLSHVSFVLEGCGDLVMMQPGSKLAAVYYSENEAADRLYGKVLHKWKEFQKDISRTYTGSKWKVSIGLGSAGTGWQSIYRSYVEARKAAMFKTNKDTVLLLEWKNVKGLSSAHHILSVKEQNEMIQSIVMGDGKFVRQQINYLFKSFEDGISLINLQELQQFFLELVVLIKWRLREMDVELEDDVEKQADYPRLIMGMHELNELTAWIRSYLTGITEKCNEIRKLPSRQSVLKVASYLENHYSEKLLLEEMANYVYMSSSHFSVLFKQHTGKSFSDYLLELRMAKARDLIKEQHSVSEVAERVGYQDIRHFSKTFKKYYGVNPSEME